MTTYQSESESVSHPVMSNSLQPHGLQPTRLLCPWNSPGKNTGMGCHSLHQGILLTQGSNLGLLHCRQIVYPLSHQGSPTYHGIFFINIFSQLLYFTSISKRIKSPPQVFSTCFLFFEYLEACLVSLRFVIHQSLLFA